MGKILEGIIRLRVEEALEDATHALTVKELVKCTGYHKSNIKTAIYTLIYYNKIILIPPKDILNLYDINSINGGSFITYTLNNDNNNVILD